MSIVVLDSISLENETKQWAAVLPNKPPRNMLLAVNQFIKTCKADGNWALLDRFWLFALSFQGNSVYSIANPTSTPCTEVNSPTWTANQGYTFNGSSMYLRTNYIPSTHGVNYSLNNATHGLYCPINIAGTFGWDMGATDATNSSNISLRDATNNSYGKVNNATAAFITVGSQADSRGMWNYDRTTSTALTMYRNGASIGTDTDVSSARPTVEMYIGCLNLNGVASSFSNKTISLAYVGSASINPVTFYNAILTLKTQIGF